MIPSFDTATETKLRELRNASQWANKAALVHLCSPEFNGDEYNRLRGVAEKAVGAWQDYLKAARELAA